MKALRKKDIDYLARLKDGRRSGRPILRIALLALPFALVLGAFAAAFFYYTGATSRLKKEDAPLQAYLQNPQNLQRQSKAVELSDQLAGYTARRDALKSDLDALADYPRLYKELYRQVISLTGNAVQVESTSFSDETGLLSLELSSSGVKDAPTYIQKLRESGLFQDIAYRGYGVDEQDGRYHFTADCLLAASAQ
ncbi:hypothetical protein LJB68_00245 [bacterium 210820-DFI.6.52]|nr:hypothetical protein [bacterium 210820-DFI.6.52]